jgi:preprotein translocase subunit SecG
MATFIYFFTIILFLILCVLLCGVILMQESKSAGLGASFGGDVNDSVFGTSTADVLKKITSWLAFFFFATCLILSLWTSSIARGRTASVGTNSEIVIPD